MELLINSNSNSNSWEILLTIAIAIAIVPKRGNSNSDFNTIDFSSGKYCVSNVFTDSCSAHGPCDCGLL